MERYPQPCSVSKKSYVQNNTSVMSSAGMGQGKMANFSVYFVRIKFYFMDSVP